MTDTRRGALPLLLVIAGIAGGVGALMAFRAPNPVPLRVMGVAPEFSLASLPGDGRGETVSLASLQGRVVFINFWATWCAPCRTEAPSLERLYQRLRPEGFEVLAVSINEPSESEEVADFRREFGLTFPILLDSDKAVYLDYRATGVPETFMIDTRGRMVEHFVGPRDWNDPRYERAILDLLSARNAGERDG